MSNELEHLYTKVDLFSGIQDEDSSSEELTSFPEAEEWAKTLKPDTFIMVCDDCGAQSEINKTEVVHYESCKLGEAKRWEKFYEEAGKEEAENLAKDPHYYDNYEE
jgi:hypothetical protein